jgi:hypothetical protein
MATAADLLQQTFNSGAIWNVTQQLDKVTPDVLGTVITAGGFVAFMAAAIQLFSALFAVYRDKDTNLMDFIAPLILKMVLIAAIMNPIVYPAIVRYLFAMPADAVANMITTQYIDKFMMDYQTVMGSISDSPNKISSLISATIDGSLISTIIAGLIFWISAILAFVTPMVQGILFLFAFYIGPVCMGFALCEFTESVFKAWISFMLTVCWIGFFGSCSWLVIESCNLLSNLSTAAGGVQPNIILTMIYGIISIVLFISCWPITTYFFGSLSEMGMMNAAKALSAPGQMAIGATAGAGVGAMMMGGTGKLLGTGLSMISKEGSTMGRLGIAMQNIGGKVSSFGSSVASTAGVRGARSPDSGSPSGPSGGKSPNIPPRANTNTGNSGSQNTTNESQTPGNGGKVS